MTIEEKMALVLTILRSVEQGFPEFAHTNFLREGEGGSGFSSFSMRQLDEWNEKSAKWNAFVKRILKMYGTS